MLQGRWTGPEGRTQVWKEDSNVEQGAHFRDLEVHLFDALGCLEERPVALCGRSGRVRGCTLTSCCTFAPALKLKEKS